MSAKKIVYLVGEPGIGKSAAIDKLTRGLERIPVGGAGHPEGGPKREWITGEDTNVFAVELGGRAGKHPIGYPGTDAMSMSAIVGVEDWLVSGTAAEETSLIIGEGARLGVKRFADAALRADWQFTLVHAVGTRTADARRKARGSDQAESWIQGARTRANNFADYVRTLPRTRVIEADLDLGGSDVLADALWVETGIE